MSDNTETQESTEETPEEVVETKSDEQEEVRQWIDALAVAEDNLLKDADDGSLEVKEMDNRDLPFTNTPSAAEIARREAQSRRTGGGPDPARPGMTYKFKTPEEAEAYGKKLGCSGFHTAGSMFMPCATHAEFMDVRGAQQDKMTAAAGTAPVGPAPGKPGMSKPGMRAMGKNLIDEVQEKALEIYGGEVVEAGYSSEEELYVVAVKQAGGEMADIWFDKDGEQMGWMKSYNYGDDYDDGYEGGDFLTHMPTAVKTAQAAFDGDVVSGEVVAGDDGVPGYLVTLLDEDKIKEVFIDSSGEKTLRLQEFGLDEKRDYDQMTRMRMAKSNEALGDGSFPIADVNDLVNALKALPRAKNRAAAVAHIKKRAKELGVEDKIPPEIFSSMPSEDMNMMKSDEEEDVEVKEEETDKASVEDSEAHIVGLVEEFTRIVTED